MANDIHWFPGHTNKALHEVEEKVKIVDVVIEIFDARAPQSSINEHLEKAIKHKKKIYIYKNSKKSTLCRTHKKTKTDKTWRTYTDRPHGFEFV